MARAMPPPAMMAVAPGLPQWNAPQQRYAPLLSSQVPNSARPVVFPSAAHQTSVLHPSMQPMRPVSGTAIGVRPSLLQQPPSSRADDTHSVLSAATSPLVPSPDEGWFRRRGGEGASSGGGPSSLNLSQSTDDVSGPLHRSSISSPSVPPAVATSRTSSKASLGRRVTSKVTETPKEKPMSLQARTKLLRRPEEVAALQTPSTASSSSKDAANKFRRAKSCDAAHGGALSPRGVADGQLSSRLSHSEASAQSECRSPSKQGRGGEGRSSGGGRSQFSLSGDTPDLSLSHMSMDLDAPCGSARLDAVNEVKSVPVETTFREGYRDRNAADVPQSMNGFSTAADEVVHPSYDDLLDENRCLREELAEARNELATYKRWYGS